MIEFTYNNVKNVSTSSTLFELNCSDYPRMLYKDEVNLHSMSKSVDKILVELRKLIIVC